MNIKAYGQQGSQELDDVTHPERDLEFLKDVNLEVSLEFGRSEISIRDLLSLGKGSILSLNRDLTDGLDLRANGKLIARGEVVVINDHLGVRVTEVVSSEDDS